MVAALASSLASLSTDFIKKILPIRLSVRFQNAVADICGYSSMHSARKSHCEVFDAVTPRPVSRTIRVTCRSQNDVSNNSELLHYGKIGDGSLSGLELSERLKGTRSMVGFGRAVNLSDTCVRAVTVVFPSVSVSWRTEKMHSPKGV